jgi:hypothetical protein
MRERSGGVRAIAFYMKGHGTTGVQADTGGSMRTTIRIILATVALQCALALAPIELGGQGPSEPRQRSTSVVALSPAKSVSGFRIVQFAIAAVLVVAFLGWIGRSRAEREDE